MPDEPCDCRYEALSAPGIMVAPIIFKPLPIGLLTPADLLMRTFPHMQPYGLYRCVTCGRYVYVRGDARAILLHEDEPTDQGDMMLDAPG